MYNRYLQNQTEGNTSHASCESPSSNQKPQQYNRYDDTHNDKHDTQKKETSSLVSLFHKLLGSDNKGGLSRLLDENTLIVLLLLFFLLKDEDGIDHDLLILAGIFLLIGL